MKLSIPERLRPPHKRGVQAKPSTPKKVRTPRKLRGPQLRAPQNVRAPKIVNDLYSDLRDRRLLIPAIALAVALVAIPVLLSGSSEPVAVPPPASAVAGEEATAVQSAVLAEEVGIRDYRKRLAVLREKNPFAQKFALPPGGGGGSGGGSGGSGSATDTSTISSTTTSTASTESVTETSSSSETTTGGGSSTQIDETTVNETTVNQPQPQIRFYAGRVDVTIGPLGKTKKVEDVRRLDLLPDDKAPVVAFVGLRDGAQKAVFSVSSDVAETSGEGSCAPKKPSPCQFLSLKIGDERKFKFVNGRTYRLKLLATHVVRIPDPRDNAADRDGDG